MKNLIDSHSHLDFKNFEKDRAQQLEKIEKEMDFIIDIASDAQSNKKVFHLAEEFPFIYGVLGLHPHDSQDISQELIGWIEERIGHPKIVAVGEIGLDYFKQYSPLEDQKNAFRQFLKLAKKHKKPVVIHSREAIKDTVEILQEETIEHAVFHCFTGTQEEGRRIVDAGYYLSFSGVITYPKNIELCETLKDAPLDRFFVETDCPFLTPEPFRGKRNEPYFVRYVAEKAAALKNLSLEQFLENNAKNVKKFFQLYHLE